MDLTLVKQLQELDTESVYFQIDDEDIQRSIDNNDKYSNHFARHYAQLNYLCYQKVIPWIREYLELDESIKMFPNEKEYFQFWEFINGSAINFNSVRLVIIPSDNYDTEEFSIPKEWIDIPEFAGDYYLAVQIDLDAKWMRIWGFTTHKNIKEEGYYDSLYRNYSLEQDQMISDLEVIWLSIEMKATTKAAIPSLLKLSNTENLVTELSKPSPFSPRLDIPFEQWGALLADENLRTQLYDLRLNPTREVSASNVKSVVEKVREGIVDLGKWLKQDFEEAIEMGWKKQSLALGYRSSSSENEEESKIQRSKIYKLKGSIGSVEELSIELLITLIPVKDDEVDFYFEVFPVQRNYFPADLKLELVCEGSVQETLITKGKETSFGSNTQSVDYGTEFEIKISYQENHLIEKFTVER